MKIVVCMPVDGRKAGRWALERLAAQRPRLDPDVRLDLVAAISPDAVESHARLVEAADGRWFPWPDVPLSAKWQQAVRMALYWYPTLDAVAMLGCDDVASDAWWRLAAAAVGDGMGAEAVGPDRVWIADTKMERAFAWSPVGPAGSPMPAGPGRVISRRALDKCNGILWPEARNRGLDMAAFKRLRDCDVRMDLIGLADRPDCMVLDRKGDAARGENLNSFESLAKTTRIIVGGDELARTLRAAGMAA